MASAKAAVMKDSWAGGMPLSRQKSIRSNSGARPVARNDARNHSGLHRRESHRGDPSGDEAPSVTAQRHRRKRQRLEPVFDSGVKRVLAGCSDRGGFHKGQRSHCRNRLLRRGLPLRAGPTSNRSRCRRRRCVAEVPYWRRLCGITDYPGSPVGAEARRRGCRKCR